METTVKNDQKGFTLIELLVVITIIALLASVVVYAANAQRKKGMTARRIADMTTVRKALEAYYQDHGNYPVTHGFQNVWFTECNHGLGAGGTWAPNLYMDNVIPGLAPNYITHVPTDPAMDRVNCTSFYAYASNGTDYKFADINISGYSNFDYNAFPDFVDPNSAVGSPNSCGFNSTTIQSLSVYSAGYKCQPNPGNSSR